MKTTCTELTKDSIESNELPVDERIVHKDVKLVLQNKIVFHLRQIVSRQIRKNLQVNVKRRSIMFDNGATAIQLDAGYCVFSTIGARDVDLRYYRVYSSHIMCVLAIVFLVTTRIMSLQRIYKRPHVGSSKHRLKLCFEVWTILLAKSSA